MSLWASLTLISFSVLPVHVQDNLSTKATEGVQVLKHAGKMCWKCH